MLAGGGEAEEAIGGGLEWACGPVAVKRVAWAADRDIFNGLGERERERERERRGALGG